MGAVQGLTRRQILYSRLFFIEDAGSLVLTQFVAKYDSSGEVLADPRLFTNLVVPIVFLSILFSSVVSPALASKQNG